MLNPAHLTSIVIDLIEQEGLSGSRRILTSWQDFARFGRVGQGFVAPHPLLGGGEELLANVNEMVHIWWNQRDLRNV
jgi:hypothetical protein